jgi:drug/metabolite transporter (DMT)-like permease
MRREAFKAMGDALVAAQDLATATCAAFNAVYFLLYRLRSNVSRPRRLGATALVLVNASLLVESFFFLALFLVHRWRGPVDVFFWPPAWLSARGLMFVGAAFISILILRQVSRHPTGSHD